jgi:NAD(P)-dependent dehydrogenase (short-subunit alcohol dehydrogenase family)
VIDLAGQAVLVTGAAGGIGAGIVRAFHAVGATVVAGYHDRPPTAADDEAHRWLAVAADLTSDDGPDHLVAAAVDRFGRLDALVNNAGRLESALERP